MIKTMNAKRHYEAWNKQESLTFLNMYLDSIKYKDETVVLDSIAAKLERTYDAIRLRVQEVKSILTDGAEGLSVSKHTPHMIEAIEQIKKEKNFSNAKLKLLF
jgi:hypothetical protein|tara:strand:- start:618 stop:926 length:309 start_codon:yes stop_codon:yes gene_type:complete